MLSTCQVMQCEKSHCNLKNGFMDLCQAPRRIKELATAKIEQNREQNQTVTVTTKKIIDKGCVNEKHIYTQYQTFYTPVDRGNVQFDTTPKQRPDPDPKLAFARILKLRSVKTAKATSKLSPKQKMIAEFMAKQGFKPVIIEPEPIPKKWVPEQENAYERNIIRGMTDIEDRCVYRSDEIKDNERPEEFIPDVTKKNQETINRRSWEKWILRFHDAQDVKLRNLQSMGF